MRRQLEREKLRIGRVGTRYRLCDGHLVGLSPARIIGTRGGNSVRSFEMQRA
jgi:hypothetical protein